VRLGITLPQVGHTADEVIAAQFLRNYLPLLLDPPPLLALIAYREVVEQFLIPTVAAFEYLVAYPFEEI
jgi:hypothetical protein